VPQSSTNLSNRLFFTICWNGETARIGTLESPQKDLVELTKEELINLARYIRYLNLPYEFLPISDGEFEDSDLSPELIKQLIKERDEEYDPRNI